MAFQVSPGVNVNEIDASSSVPAIVTSTGGVVGRFAKGPVSEIVEISSEEQLLNIFGAPDDTNYKSWFTAANFLAYSTSLKVVRVVDGDDLTVANRARNALSGKVSASTSASGAEQLFAGVAATDTTLYGSSAQSFSVNTNGDVSVVNLHSGLVDAASGGTINQHLHPRSSTVVNASDGTYTLVDATVAIAGSEVTNTMIRTLTGADVSVFVRETGKTTGGLLPASRYSIAAAASTTAGQNINFVDSIGNTSIAGPYYVHHSGTTGGQRLVTSGTAATAMPEGFTYPLYKRQSVANVADSGIYGGAGASHVHYFPKYGGVADVETLSANTLNLSADHGLTIGDPVVYVQASAEDIGLTANTVYYIASVSTNAVTLSSSFDYAATTAGTVITLTGSASAATHNLYQAFYMPSSTTATNHSKSTAPVDSGMKPFANASDTMTIKVTQQSVFQMRTTPGSYAVSNGLITSVQAGTVTDGAGADSVTGSHATTDFTVSSSNINIVFSENLPRTGQTEVVGSPAQKAFTLSPAVNIANGETVEVKVADVVSAVGSAVGQYVLSSDGSTITFGGIGSDAGFAPAADVQVKVNITSKMNNTFVYDTKTLLINNKTSFESSTYFGNVTTTGGHEFAARSPGVWGNNVHVYLIDESSYEDFKVNEPSLAANLSGIPSADDKTVDPTANAPTGSESVTQGISMIVTDINRKDEVVVVEVLEHMSKALNGRTQSGKNIYYVDVINQSSSYVFSINHPATTGMDWGTNISLTPGSVKTSFAKLNQSASTADGTENYISRPFGNGSIGIAPKQGHFQSGFDLFSDVESVDCGFLLQGESADLSIEPAGMIGYIIDVASTRKDCIACISPTEAIVAADKIATSSLNTRTFFKSVRKSNYAFADSNYKYISDKYNNKFRFVPFNGDTAGLMVRSEQDRDSWFSPAGFNRGVYKGVIKTMTEQTKSQRDALYQEAINPVVNFAGQGTVLFGDKTFTLKPSAFDRINVRRLFIVLEKSIATAAKFTLFEFNDEFTRAQFTSLIEPFLRDVKGRRGIFDFKVVCDSTNNTANVIDTNQFVGDIFIQPARSINFIQLNFVAVRTGVSFDEIVGVV